MSKKDYVAVADTVRELRNSSILGTDGWDRVIHTLVKVFQKDNPRFDSQRFWEYIERQFIYPAQSSKLSGIRQAMPKNGGEHTPDTQAHI